MSAVRVRHRPPDFAVKQADAAKRKTAGQERIALSLPFLSPEGPVLSLDRLFQFLRGAEGDLFARLDLDRFAGGRVAAHARGALAHLKDAEAADADALALLHRS